MASRELEILLTLKDRASKELKSFNTNLKSLEPSLTAVRNIGVVGFTAITGAIALSVKETMEAEAAQNRLTQILKTSRGATDAQVSSLLKQADALEKVGVIAADSIVQAQAQLATFDLEAESIERLTPAILDYVVAEKGASASTDDLRSLTNGLAQALQGNFASLTKTGFVLDEATKELIANGTEAERTAALVSVLDSTYKGFNASARETAEGSLIVMKNEFNNLRQAIGEAFIPVLAELTKTIAPIIQTTIAWAQEHPELVRQIGFAALAITGLMVAIGTLSLAILAFNPIVAGIVLAITGFIFIIRQLNEIVKILQNDMGTVWAGIKVIFQEAIDWIISKTLEPLMAWIDRIISAVNRAKDAVGGLGGKVSNAVKSGVSGLGKVIGVNDAVIAPNGNIISTHPDDYLIATKNPGSLGGGGIVVNVYGDVSGQELVDKVSSALGLDIKRQLRLT